MTGRKPFIEIYPRLDGLYDWRLIGRNGEIACSSLQGFRDTTDAKRAAHRVAVLFQAELEIRTVEHAIS